MHRIGATDPGVVTLGLVGTLHLDLPAAKARPICV